MSPFKKKIDKIDIEPGEGAYFPVYTTREQEEVVIKYNDKYGNKYETRALINFKERKIVRQEFNIVKKVKDIPESEMPKLVIDEKIFDE